MSSPGVAAFAPLRLGAVRPAGWLLAQLQRDLDQGLAGCLDRLTERVSSDPFAHRIGSSADQTTWWDAETRGNWLWGYTMMAHLSGNAEHRGRADGLVAALRSTADVDGYLGIYAPADRYGHGDDENGELWAQSRALVVLLAHHELTGDEASLRSARAAADLTLRHYGPGHPYFRRPGHASDLTGMTHGLNYTDAVDRLFLLTGDRRYREFAAWLYEDFARQDVPFQNDDLAPANVLDPTLPLRGHAAHTAEHLRPLLVARGGDRALVAAALRKLRLHSVPSGALIGDESVHGVPMPDSGYEVCTMAELLWSLCATLQLTGETALGDWMERLMSNALQGARRPDGRAVSYLTPDTRLSATLERPDVYALIEDGIGRYKVSPTHEDIAACCAANATRVVPHYLSGMWLRQMGRPGLVAALYGPCVVETVIDGVNVRIEEDTAYPFEDAVRFAVSPARPVRFELRLRRPAWAGAATLDGADATEGEDFLVIDRTWRAGDSVTLSFAPAITAIPYATREVAVQRGPLQFVQPIAHRERVVKRYPVDGFADVELLPDDAAALGRYPVLYADRAELGLAVEHDPDADPDHPFDRPPFHLRGDVDLVPMGCSLLRRAAFGLMP
jgi:hypothetical protein